MCVSFRFDVRAAGLEKLGEDKSATDLARLGNGIAGLAVAAWRTSPHFQSDLVGCLDGEKGTYAARTTLVTAGLANLFDVALVRVLVTERTARTWWVERVQAVVVEGAHIFHASHLGGGEHRAALVPYTKTEGCVST